MQIKSFIQVNKKYCSYVRLGHRITYRCGSTLEASVANLKRYLGAKLHTYMCYRCLRVTAHHEMVEHIKPDKRASHKIGVKHRIFDCCRHCKRCRTFFNI